MVRWFLFLIIARVKEEGGRAQIIAFHTCWAWIILASIYRFTTFAIAFEACWARVTDSTFNGVVATHISMEMQQENHQK